MKCDHSLTVPYSFSFSTAMRSFVALFATLLLLHEISVASAEAILGAFFVVSSLHEG